MRGFRIESVGGVDLLRKERSPYYYLGLVTGLGVTMIVCVMLGLVFGLYLDSRFSTSPWFAFSFVVLGMVAGGWTVYRMIMEDSRYDETVNANRK